MNPGFPKKQNNKIHKNQILRSIFLALTVPVVYFLWSSAEKSGLFTAPDTTSISSDYSLRGLAAPDFQMQKDESWTGESFQLSQVKQGKVLLHFWATWCGPCLEELPLLEKFALANKNRGIRVVAVASQDTRKTLLDFFNRFPKLASLASSLTLMIDESGRIATLYGSQKFPETFLINSNMKIENKFVGTQNWTNPGFQSLIFQNLEPNSAKEGKP